MSPPPAGPPARFCKPSRSTCSGWQSSSATYATIAKATLTSPTPGSALTSTSQVFTWTAATGALEYSFWIGTTPGGLDLYAQSQGTSTTSPTMPLPAGGVPLYISLWTRTAAGWPVTRSTVIAATP